MSIVFFHLLISTSFLQKSIYLKLVFHGLSDARIFIQKGLRFKIMLRNAMTFFTIFHVFFIYVKNVFRRRFIIQELL
jgi:hypothetical protein